MSSFAADAWKYSATILHDQLRGKRAYLPSTVPLIGYNTNTFRMKGKPDRLRCEGARRTLIDLKFLRNLAQLHSSKIQEEGKEDKSRMD